MRKLIPIFTCKYMICIACNKEWVSRVTLSKITPYKITCYPKQQACLSNNNQPICILSMHIDINHTCFIFPCAGLNYNTRLTRKSLVRHENARFNTKIHGSTQKCPVRHKNALPGIHQLPCPYQIRPFLWEISFQIFVEIFCFKEPMEKWKMKLYWYSNIFDIIVKYVM